MRSRMSLFALLLVVGSFVLPIVAHAAAIPFFGPIIPNEPITINNVASNQNVCAAGWGMLITVINNIIAFSITIAIVFVAPIMIAYAGFLFVINPVNASGKEKAKGVLWNTIVGIVIALAGWMIVDALMVVLYNPNAQNGGTRLGAWSQLITSGGLGPCIDLRGSVPPTVAPPAVGVACSIPPLSAITDSSAQQMEAMNGNAVIWTNTDPRLQPCVNRLISSAGGTVTSAYRPPAYQTHLYEIRDRWCTQGLQSNSNSACSSLKNIVSNEIDKHFGLRWSCRNAVGATSRHSSGTGVDISGVNATSEVLRQSCLTHPIYQDDIVHYELVNGCSCQ